MAVPRQALSLIATVVVLAVALGARASAGSESAVPVVPQAPDRGTFTFAPGTHPLDQQAVRDAVARARPEAQRLIALIDGRTTIAVGVPVAMKAAGLAQSRPDGRFDVTLDLGNVNRVLGTRGMTRLVLHELGHVVDHLLVPPDLAKALDDAVPPGYPCGTAGDDGSCVGRSAREERFAETFAKWAMDDLGVSLNIGYKVPPPSSSLSAWGAPLATLGG